MAKDRFAGSAWRESQRSGQPNGLRNRMALQVGRRKIDGAHENVTLGPTAGRGNELRSAVLELAVLENHQVARVQLLRRTCSPTSVGVHHLLIIFIQIRLGAVAFPVQDIEDNKLLLVLMWLRHDIGVRPEQIDPECASLLPPVFGHKAEKCLDKVPGLRVLKQFDTLVDTLALNLGAIPDGYGLVFFEGQFAVVPLVQDDVSRPLAIMWPVTLVMPELATVEVGSLKVLPALRREADIPFGGQSEAVLSYVFVNSA